MNTIVYEETLTGQPHDTSVQKATSDNKMWMQFNVMPRNKRPDGETTDGQTSWGANVFPMTGKRPEGQSLINRN